jgi:hypothetical protein
MSTAPTASGSRAAVSTMSPNTTTDARMPGSASGTNTPAMPSAPPASMALTKAAGQAQSARPRLRPAHSPTARRASIWSRPVQGWVKPDAREPDANEDSNSVWASAGWQVPSRATAALRPVLRRAMARTRARAFRFDPSTSAAIASQRRMVRVSLDPQHIASSTPTGARPSARQSSRWRTADMSIHSLSCAMIERGLLPLPALAAGAPLPRCERRAPQTVRQSAAWA